MTILIGLEAGARVLARDAAGRFVRSLVPSVPSLRLPGIPNYAAPVQRLLGTGAKFRDILGRFTTPQGSYVTELNRIDGSQRLPMDLYITDGRKPRGPGMRYLYDVSISGRDKNGRAISTERSITSSRHLTIDQVYEEAEYQARQESPDDRGSPPFFVGEVDLVMLGAYRK